MPDTVLVEEKSNIHHYPSTPQSHAEVGQYQEEDEIKEVSSTADRTFQDNEVTTSHNNVKLSHSAVFLTPPTVPPQAIALPTEMDTMGMAMMGQADAAGQGKRVEHGEEDGRCLYEGD